MHGQRVYIESKKKKVPYREIDFDNLKIDLLEATGLLIDGICLCFYDFFKIIAAEFTVKNYITQ